MSNMDSGGVSRSNFWNRNFVLKENTDIKTPNDNLALNNISRDQNKTVPKKQPEPSTDPTPQYKLFSSNYTPLSPSSECSLPSNKPSQEPNTLVNYFQEHMAQWELNFRKPLIVPSSTVGSQLPWHYSKEYFDSLHNQNDLTMGQNGDQSMSPFASWNVEMDKRGQEALEYYRKLSSQPRNLHNTSECLLYRKPNTV